MNFLRERSTYNENQGVTPRLKPNVQQFPKTVFRERHNRPLLPSAISDWTPTKKTLKFTPKVAPCTDKKAQEERKNLNKYLEFGFPEPCCSKESSKPLSQIWGDMNLIDDAKLDALLKISDFEPDEIDSPMFSLPDDNDDEFLQSAQADNLCTEQEIVFPPMEMLKYEPISLE